MVLTQYHAFPSEFNLVQKWHESHCIVSCLFGDNSATTNSLKREDGELF